MRKFSMQPDASSCSHWWKMARRALTSSRSRQIAVRDVAWSCLLLVADEAQRDEREQGDQRADLEDDRHGDEACLPVKRGRDAVVAGSACEPIHGPTTIGMAIQKIMRMPRNLPRFCSGSRSLSQATEAMEPATRKCLPEQTGEGQQGQAR